jgi:Protein of unknown function (DUF2786)
MSTELDRIKFKIKALAAKTVANGCSEHEAMSAMEGVGRLLSQYNLTMEECDVRESACRTIYLDIGRQRRHPIDSCITSLADLVNAKCWFHRRWDKHGRAPSAYAFFGQEQDLELIEYLFKVIHSAIEHEAEEFKQEDAYQLAGDAGKRRSATVSFQRGMATRIGQRLRELKAANEAELAKHRVTGTALMVLKAQLIEEEWEKQGVRLSGGRSSWRIGDGSAFMHGQKAGDRVNLNRPLGGAGKANGGLLS